MATTEDGLAVGLRSLAEQQGLALDNLVTAAQTDQLRQFLESTNEQTTPAVDLDTLHRRLRLIKLSA